MAEGCRYSDCRHADEPGCAVRQAIEDGNLAEERLNGYHKLIKEMSYQDMNSRQLEEAKIRTMFGGKNAMKQAMDYVKKQHKQH